HRGKGTHVTFEESMHRAALERLVLESDLRSALERGELEMHYQPVVHLPTRRIVGAEALLRWRHPERGMVPPSTFIPLAESTGLILPIGRWALNEACREAAAWQNVRQGAGVASQFTIGVNISPWQIQQPDLVETVRSALQDSGLAPENLILEMTES